MESKLDYLREIDLGVGLPLFESRGEYIFNRTEQVPEYPELTSIDELKSSQIVVRDLSAINWAFTFDDTGFLTHDLHPYPAKYIPQIPGHIISRLSLPGELVFDPFGGSGTTALEAVRLGRRAISVDANPIGTLIGQVKTCSLNRTITTDLHSIRCALLARLDELPVNPEILCRENAAFIPKIPNIDKWFPFSSRGELALIKSRLCALESEVAKNIGLLALSRIILSSSFQDSETRYSSKPREIPIGDTIKKYILALDDIIQNVQRTQPALRYGISKFITSDINKLQPDSIENESIDLIVTSPPYGNAMDYHLYHRFRLFWLGFDPRKLAKIEIGSHLRHQKEATGFSAYLAEMKDTLHTIFQLLKPGRYAVLVIGDAIYKKVLYKGAESVGDLAQQLGFENLAIIERQIHETKRSFISAGRRATTEKLLILKKPTRQIKIKLSPPPYNLWHYESLLRKQEIQCALGQNVNGENGKHYTLTVDPYIASEARKLVFTHSIDYSKTKREPTWQSVIENGLAFESSSRKDPKYVTHGLHSYKGKFYPQLAKGLINLSGVSPGARIFDPFCGSGTSLLEGYLNGFEAFGCDMNPLAAKLAKAKVGIIDINPDVFRETIGTLVKKIEVLPENLSQDRSQFPDDTIEEIEKWFPMPVINKLNHLLKIIRSVSDGILRDFLEVILSSLIREVSHQDPNDLRIRRRKMLMEDADVFSIFLNRLEVQCKRIEGFWSIRGYAPNKFIPAKVIEGDSRKWNTLSKFDLGDGEIDLILTSPPYATALPYIDTDRLSLLVLFGLDSPKRRPIEQNLVGSREIITSERKKFEKMLKDSDFNLPNSVVNYLQNLHHRISDADVGFRRKNMPSLLLRFFLDTHAIIENCYRALRKNGQALIVIGDNRIKVDSDYERIATTDFVEDISTHLGFKSRDRIDISVTRENVVHIKNSITKNVVLKLEKS